MKLVTVKMPEAYIDGLDELVRLGRYSSRSEVIRIAVRDLLKKELWIMPSHTSTETPLRRVAGEIEYLYQA
jgi:antitoxin ParD1/3/4